MEKQPKDRMLDSKEACEEFRKKYFDSAFKAAFSITGTYSDARALTMRLFEDMETRFQSMALPSAPELYILSHINLLYAKGELTYGRRPEAAPAKPSAADTPQEIQASEKSEPPKAPTARADAAEPASEEPAPETPAQDTADNTKVQYDPKLTELWLPGGDPERPSEHADTLPEQAAAWEVSRTSDAEDSVVADEAPEENERSIPLTIVNTVLFIALLGSALFASVQMGLFKLFT